ncbi:MAG: transposase, partial [Patescibacteria group bacterium]
PTTRLMSSGVNIDAESIGFSGPASRLQDGLKAVLLIIKFDLNRISKYQEGALQGVLPMRPPHIFTDESSYFVTTTLSERGTLFTDSRLAIACLEALMHAVDKTGTKIFCYVLMPDHFHAVVNSTVLPKFMNLFKGSSSHAVNIALGRKDTTVWQAGYWEMGLRSQQMFIQKLNYTHWNPVKAGIIKRAEEYPYSSARQFVEKYRQCLFEL